ncbi:MAG: hypothetical protein KC549_08855, partial [Myxococcales bacterium]|nr:hypothetical protein [Myxococcales bacterium]
PSYACPAGRVMMGTDANGLAVCGNVTCPVGQYFRGLDGAGNAICAADEGLRALPAQVCPDGQAVLRVAANGTTTCGSPRAGDQTCPEGEFVTGLTPEGSVICAEGAAGEGGGGGQCVPGEVRPNIYVCTNSGRSVQTFVPAGFNFNIVIGRCDPDANTQAMLVSRSGGGEAAGRAAQWAQYVEGGGNIITEYNVSHLVFNAVFGGGAAQGPRRGGCHDNAMPPVKVNVDDPFWRANPAIQVVPPAEAPCGYEVGAFPGVTPLGGWAENQISLAYRDKGAGRLWLVDADWQDNENYWLPQSSALMGAMMTWCGGADGGDDGDALVFNGVRTNVPEGEVVGWRECHRSLYGQGGLSMAQVQAQCDGDQIMYGCQANGAGKWQVLAQGARAAVFRDIGQANNPTVDNGVGWYFSTTWSLGFAPAGQAISRNSCDTENGLADQRICWHSSNGNMDGGWRCGANTGLNGNNGFTRVIWTRNAGGGGGGGGGEVGLGANRGFGHHGACNGWNACGNAQSCANAACQMFHGTNAVRWQEGLCQDLARIIPGGMDCDLFAALPNNLDANWGNGCNIPVAYDVVCAAPGGGGGGGLAFQGVRENTPDANIGAAWRVCHTSTFGANVPGLTALLANACAGNRLMVGCRPVGAANWTLLAQGARAAVLADTGNGNATVRDNGVEWYYSNQWSMGFANQGDAVSRNSCDTQGGNGNLRMCWHTGGDALNSGYRCG